VLHCAAHHTATLHKHGMHAADTRIKPPFPYHHAVPEGRWLSARELNVSTSRQEVWSACRSTTFFAHQQTKPRRQQQQQHSDTYPHSSPDNSLVCGSPYLCCVADNPIVAWAFKLKNLKPLKISRHVAGLTHPQATRAQNLREQKIAPTVSCRVQ
jgi:hypothetical protein